TCIDLLSTLYQQSAGAVSAFPLSLPDALPIYARVTFDRGLEYAPRERFDPIPVDAEMTPSDIEPLFDPETNVILELKCYTAYVRSEEHTSELQSRENLVCRLWLENKK